MTVAGLLKCYEKTLPLNDKNCHYLMPTPFARGADFVRQKDQSTIGTLG